MLGPGHDLTLACSTVPILGTVQTCYLVPRGSTVLTCGVYLRRLRARGKKRGTSSLYTLHSSGKSRFKRGSSSTMALK